MMKNALIALLFVVEASAFEYCGTQYDGAGCTGDKIEQTCYLRTADGTCQTDPMPGYESPVYYIATCVDGNLTMTKYDDSSCTETSPCQTETHVDGYCSTTSYNTSGGRTRTYSWGETVDCSKSGSDPCFADTTMACRLNDATVPPSIAFQQCFGDEVSANAPVSPGWPLLKIVGVSEYAGLHPG